jgi:hypothetical protein
MSDKEVPVGSEDAQEREDRDDTHAAPRKSRARKIYAVRIKDMPTEEMDAIADEYISGIPYVQRNTIRKKIEGLRDSIIQRRKDGQNIVDISLGYKNAFDSYLPMPVSLSYIIKLVSEVSKDAFPRKAKTTEQGAGTAKASAVAPGRSLPARPADAAQGAGATAGRSALEEARRHAEERAQAGAKPSPFPPGYREKDLSEL